MYTLTSRMCNTPITLALHCFSDSWYVDRKADAMEESERVVRLAGKLIAAAIRELDLRTESYPYPADLSNSLSGSESAGVRKRQWQPTMCTGETCCHCPTRDRRI